MSDLKICVPGMFTHAHRTPERKREFCEAFAAAGVTAVPDYSKDCDAIFFGDHSVFTAELLRVADNHEKPVVHYLWDLYDCNVHGSNWAGWKHYLECLAKSDRVIAPSKCTITKLEKYAGRSGHVVKAPVRVWDKLDGPPPKFVVGGVVDVMRPYPDRNAHITHRACVELGLPCVATKTAFDWDTFRHAIANARLLVSPYHEASTGGLTLLEGYWHGVPCLLSDSPLNGVVDYFGDRGNYFHWDDYKDFRDNLEHLYHNPPVVPDEADRREWIVREYSEETFVRNIVRHVREVVG